MTEEHSPISLAYFPRGFEKSQFEEQKQVGYPSEAWVTSSTEALNYFLRNYAHSKVTNQTINELRAVHQGPEKKEQYFIKRIGGALRRCTNIHEAYEIIYLFI